MLYSPSVCGAHPKEEVRFFNDATKTVQMFAAMQNPVSGNVEFRGARSCPSAPHLYLSLNSIRWDALRAPFVVFDLT